MLGQRPDIERDRLLPFASENEKVYSFRYCLYNYLEKDLQLQR